MKEPCDFRAFTAHCLGNNLLHIEMKKVKKFFSEDIAQMYDCFKKSADGKKVYVLVTFNGFVSINDDAMTEAKIQNKSEIQGGVAYVVQNLALRMGIRFFMNFHKPNYPINIVSSKAQGILWLKQIQRKK